MSKEVKHIHKVGDNTFLFETYEKPLRTQIEKLKQQLAEKDKENERLKEEICKYEITLMDKNSQLKKQHQDKISFTIQQLQRVKEKTKSFYGEYSASVVVCIIDQIIKEIGGESESKSN